jgi:hypothetical protein
VRDAPTKLHGRENYTDYYYMKKWDFVNGSQHMEMLRAFLAGLPLEEAPVFGPARKTFHI